MRGMISGKGLSTMEMDLIFGGLHDGHAESPKKEQRHALDWSFILVQLYQGVVYRPDVCKRVT